MALFSLSLAKLDSDSTKTLSYQLIHVPAINLVLRVLPLETERGQKPWERELSASISSLVVSLYAEFKHKSYENDVFIASAISNIFQNYNYCSLEMEQLSLDISIVKICLLNYFINCWWLSYRQNMHLRKKKGKQIWKLSKIVYNVYLEGHFHLWIKILSIINQERA